MPSPSKSDWIPRKAYFAKKAADAKSAEVAAKRAAATKKRAITIHKKKLNATRGPTNAESRKRG